MMQHRAMEGVLVAIPKRESFEERMQRITDSLLQEGALVTLNCRINGGRAPWFALRVWTGREKTVENTLDGMGIQALVPMRKGADLRRRHRLIEGQMMPVIQGYVLVQMFPKAEYLTGLQGVEHAIDVLGGCEKPVRLSNKEVSIFNALAQSGVYDAERVVGLVLHSGERVRIMDGPFCGLSAKVVTPSRKGRGDVVVSIRLMGGEVPVTVPLAMLRKL